MRFVKMHGLGNDYVYVDCFNQPIPDDPAALSRAVSRRSFGIGSDASRDLAAPVTLTEPLGPALLCHTARLRFLAPPDAPIRTGDVVPLVFSREHLHYFDPAGPRIN